MHQLGINLYYLLINNNIIEFLFIIFSIIIVINFIF